ncbi:MAG TPA: formimidoylglutamate deiminase [Kiloniellales bacterium]|nr:formimidoylglutamate deiminase [Kiloniellales bacterium]
MNGRSEVFHAPAALLPQGWQENVRIEVSAAGDIVSLTAGQGYEQATRLAGAVVPGMPNLHSHAFQRAMAGLAEVAGASEDSFWTWREVMYGFVGRLSPEQVETVATQLYIEMLKGGYTAVGEFHYLHHQPDGTPYAELAEMSNRIAAAAAAAGIGLTHLPVLYGYGGFGGKPAGQGQRRFLNDPERYARILEDFAKRHHGDPQVRLGIAPHSLRAVTQETLEAGIAALDRIDKTAPIHIHIAEQTKEVDDCRAWSHQTPVEWLLSHALVDQRWCLVHATHMTDVETRRLAATEAVAGLCPTTEANLGDGFFNVPQYLAAEGRWGIGSDSHISVSAIEDLRWLEYGQRLKFRRRNLMHGGQANVGAFLWRHALAGGAQALGRKIGRLEPGWRADFLVLDAQHPALAARQGDALLDALVFAGNVNPIRDVFVGGKHLVQQGRHVAEAPVARRYARTLQELLA